MDGTLLSAHCLEQLGLTQQPFLPQWQEAFGFSDTSLDMPLNVTLEHLRDASPPILIKGEYGIGKSTQLKRLMARGEDLHFCLIEAGPDTSMAAVDYGVRLQWQPHPRHGDPKKLSLDRYLAALCEDGMRPVLLVDDAHHLEPKVLGTLLNLKQHMHRKLGHTLGVVLTGERSIDDTLALLEGKLRIVDDLYAIGTRPLNREQTARYIDHRLQAAGRTGPLPLDAEDLDRIQQETGGLPGDINKAAITALLALCSNGQTETGAQRSRKSLPGRLLMPTAIVLVVIGLLASLYGLITGLLGPEDDTVAMKDTAASTELAIPSPQSDVEERDDTTSPPAPATAPVAAPDEAAPEPLTQAPEDAVPRLADASPTETEAPAPATSSPRFDFSADFEEEQPPEPVDSLPAVDSVAPEDPVTDDPPPRSSPTPAAAEPPADSTPSPAPAETTASAPPPPIAAMPLPAGDLQGALWLMRQDPDHYTVQVLGVSSESAARTFYQQHAAGIEAVVAPTRRAGKDWYVLVIGVFSSAEQARRAIPALPGEIQKNQPFIRRIGPIQEAVLSAR